MNYITTTELRTKTSELTRALQSGQSVSLLHRSRIIGVFKPADNRKKPFDSAGFKALVKSLKLPKTTHAQRERLYRKHMTEKYGKYIR